MSLSVRKGTATRKAGVETSARVIQAAHDLLESQPLSKFSMRNVADGAGVSLANLQYYFPRREDLVHAMFEDIGQRYQIASQHVVESQAAKSPIERFEAILRFHLEDASKRTTRQFFIQFWALLGSMDNFEGRYLEELYAIDIGQLSEHIAQLHSGMPKAKIQQKALLIASMVEGLMVVLGETSKNPSATKRSIQAAFEAARMIALQK